MLKIGSMLGMYRVLHDVGRGGSGHVYLVLNERAGKQWAAKEVAKDGGDEMNVVGNGLIADAEMLKKLDHPNIPSIVDVLETDTHYYILMDYVEGVTLKEVIDTKGPQKQEDVVKWAIQLCDVFIYLHSQDPKIIYRDTKPSNIMLQPSGDIALIDFGSAREYKANKDNDTTALGSRGYAAPEQYEGVAGQTDERTDIYNLGVTLYHLLTGHNPGQPPYDIYPIRHWNASLSSGLERIILKCTQQNPEDRYQNAGDLRYDLEHYTDLDIEKERVKKIKTFVGSIFLIVGAVMILASIPVRNMAIKRMDSGYESVLKNASLATTAEDRISLYEQAVSLQPERVEAYTSLLDTFLEDDTFSQKEADELTKILNDYSGSRTNEESLENNEDYDSFAYQAGLAYFYYYEGKGNKSMARTWLETAAKSATLSSDKVERASCLSKIAGYYDDLGKEDLAGDKEVSYADYWNDLDTLTKDDIAEIDNAKTACVTYQELSYQMRMHASDFKKAGIEKKQMIKKLSAIDMALLHLADDEKETYKDMITTIKDNIAGAEDAISVAYDGQEG